MEFIGGGVEEDEEDRNGRFAPAPGAGIAANRFTNGAPEQSGEDGVFGEVTAFANGVMNGLDVRLGHVGKKPMQEWFDQPRRVRVRFSVTGADEDERHPGQRHEPVFKKRPGFRHCDNKLICGDDAKLIVRSLAIFRAEHTFRRAQYSRKQFAEHLPI